MSNTILKETKPKCQALAKCCSSKDYSKALSLMAVNFSIDPLPVMFSACLGSLDPSHLAKTCPSALKFSSPLAFEPDSDTDDDNSNPFIAQLNKSREPIRDILQNIARVCKSNEAYSYICLSNKKLLQTCVKKILEKQLNTNGMKNYKELTNNYKNAFNSINILMEMVKSIASIQS
ncbi:unnamed protein product [Rotaria sp. Silwood1]|nr:unnamed protein product [Rotaria sp. Silwood1]CAF1615950.1 unnamed protein product [Rotaria sp. Silwood1]CAF1616752.1 unnamed protein product [Rotaria sp. Silwood1]CAF3733396.1 unnamed protein product [Rotaria sp. Silwood1]CAF4958844.1 unnamed protein product [Rotaria sp. Silwood1]